MKQLDENLALAKLDESSSSPSMLWINRKITEEDVRIAHNKYIFILDKVIERCS